MKRYTNPVILIKTIIVGIFVVVLIPIAMVAHMTGVIAISTNSYTKNFRVTVTVETPEGLKTGSAVRQIWNGRELIDLPDVGNPAGVRGEAVVVDLGERGVLFALISHESDNEFKRAFHPPAGMSGREYWSSLKPGERRELDPRTWPGYPKLVTFTDMDDPMTVTLAQVWERDQDGFYFLKEDRMEELFGEGVKLNDIVFEITEEPVISGIIEIIPWLEDVKVGYLDGRTVRTSNQLSNTLHIGNFKRGMSK